MLDERKHGSSSERFLYHYYGKENHILEALRQRRLYHCLPSEFKDPFDCRPLISIRYNRYDNNATWREFLYYHLKLSNEVNKLNLSEAEIMKQADIAFDNGLHKNQSWLNKYIVEELKTVGELVRVYCCSKSPRNMMMWAHYAMNHRGVAFQLRKSGLKDKATGEYRGKTVTYDSKALGVEDYVRAMKRYIDHRDVSEMASIVYSRKTNHWEREEEVRFFSKNDRPYLSFTESVLSGIVFGADCSECLIGEVLYTLNQWQDKPRLFKASIEKSTYKLWIGKYENTQKSRAVER